MVLSHLMSERMNGIDSKRLVNCQSEQSFILLDQEVTEIFLYGLPGHCYCEKQRLIT